MGSNGNGKRDLATGATGMRDMGHGVWATDAARERARNLDTMIFDVDGVLIDVSQSFRICICKAVQHYLTDVLGWPNGEYFLRPEETEYFKRAGGFNSDWTLTDAAALLYLAKGIDRDDKSPAALRALPPSVAEYMGEAGDRGGGMDHALAALRETFPPETMERALTLWNRDTLRQLFCEYYAGKSRCLTVYGFEAEYIDFEDGELTRENVLIDAGLLPRAWKYGIVTGRDRGEFTAGFPMTRMDALIPVKHTLTADDGLHKPDPNGLITLCERLRPTVAAYVGDTVDDMRTVFNFRASSEEPPFLACQVLTGPAGEKNRLFFAEEGADVIAPDVNALIQWLASVAEGVPAGTRY